jgi:hypothetical protein
MSNEFDANIKLLYPVNSGNFFTIQQIPQGDGFDVIANVEVGEDLNGVIDRHKVRVGIVNLTQAKAVGKAETLDEPVNPQNNVPLLAELRIPIPGGWTSDAEVGDVLQVVASYTVTAGVNTDFSAAQSVTFVVS